MIAGGARRVSQHHVSGFQERSSSIQAPSPGHDSPRRPVIIFPASEAPIMDAPGATEPPGSVDDTRGNSEASVAQRAHDDRDSPTQRDNDDVKGNDGDDNEYEDDEDEEPQLKYAYLTKHLGSLYRNGDATSAFLSAGDKMVCYPRASRRYPD